MKDELCKVFCGGLNVRTVPLGLAVQTGFRREDGDSIGFYVIRDSENPGRARLEDDGDTIPYLESLGVDMTEGPRGEALNTLLAEHGVRFDRDEYVVHSDYMPAAELPAAAMRFVAFLLRVQDFSLLTRERVEDTFRADVIAAVREKFSAAASIDLDRPIAAAFEHFPADVVLATPAHKALALFIATSENRALEALIFWYRLQMLPAPEYRAMLVLESAKTGKIKERTIARAMNSGMPIAAFRGEETPALEAIARLLDLQVSGPLQ